MVEIFPKAILNSLRWLLCEFLDLRINRDVLLLFPDCLRFPFSNEMLLESHIEVDMLSEARNERGKPAG